MTDGHARQEVLAAAEARAAALAAGDGERLLELLHPELRWTSHTGETFDRTRYVATNTAGTTVWHQQVLADPEVVVVGDTAILHAVATDVVAQGDATEALRMPVTMVWIKSARGWRCLAGHAGPRLR